MDADERGLENPKPIFWKPTPDMYRMDTPQGREAYEARFGVKIGASGDRDIATSDQRGHLAIGTPPRAAVPHEHGGTYDPSQMHAKPGISWNAVGYDGRGREATDDRETSVTADQHKRQRSKIGRLGGRLEEVL